MRRARGGSVVDRLEPAERYRGVDPRASVGRALDAQAAVEHREPVPEADEAAPVGPRATDAVVADVEVERVLLDARLDGGEAGPSVLGDVGERLRPR